MVLFTDTEVKLPPTRRRKWITRIIKTIVFGAIFLWIGLTILSRVGTSEGFVKDSMKSGIEQYFSQATGYNTTIDRLHAVRLYPHVLMDAQNMVFIDRVTKKSAITVETFQISMGFWGLIHRHEKLEHFAATNVYLSSTVHGLHDILIENIGFSPSYEFGEKTEIPALHSYGQIGENDYVAALQTDIKNNGYIIPETSQLKITLADVILSGLLSQEKDHLKFVIEKLALGEASLISGEATLARRDDLLHTKLDWILGEDTALTGHFKFSKTAPLIGSVTISNLTEDTAAHLAAIIDRIESLLWPETEQESEKNAGRIKVKIDNKTHDIHSLSEFTSIIKGYIQP